MKKFVSILTVLALCLSFGTVLAENKTIKVGASPVPHAQILEIIKPILAEKGFDLEIVEFTDYVLPNLALESGELDANYFQHKPYLDNFNAENGTHLIDAFGVHLEPMLLFGGKSTDITAIKEGAVIAVPNDPSNESRGLRLLESQGIITLNAEAGVTATKLDIAENPYKVEIYEVEAAQVPRALADVDFATINVNYALDAGLLAEDALVVEPTEGNPNINVLAVKEGTENEDFVAALNEALHSEAVTAFIAETYKGSVIPAL